MNPIFTSGPQMSAFTLASDIEAPLIDVLGAEASDAWRNSPLSATRRLWNVGETRGEINMTPEAQERVQGLPYQLRLKAERDEKNFAIAPGTGEGLILSKDQADEQVAAAGVKVKIPVYGVTEGYLKILIQAAQQEQAEQEVFMRARQSFATGAARLGTGLAVSLVDPINIASAFIPITGTGRLVNLGYRAFGRVAPPGRLLPAAAGARARARFREGAVEGAFGAALVEPVILAAADAEQADYDMTDSLLNVAFGTVIGGGLHTGVGFIRDKMITRKVLKEFDAKIKEFSESIEPDGAATRALDNATPEMRADLMRGSVAQMSEGYPVNVEIVGEFTPVRLVDRQEPNPAPRFETQDEEVLARVLYPEEMQEYDALVKQRDDLRAQIDALNPDRRAAADDAVEEIRGQIDALAARMEGATKRNQKKIQVRIDELQARYDAELKRVTSVDTPEQARVRRELMSTDEKLRDKGPRIGQIKREAKARAEFDATPVPDRPEYVVRPKWEVDPEVDVVAEAQAARSPENLRLADPEASEEIAGLVGDGKPVDAIKEIDELRADTADLTSQYEGSLERVGLKDEDMGVDADAQEAEILKEVVDDMNKYAEAAVACFGRRG